MVKNLFKSIFGILLTISLFTRCGMEQNTNSYPVAMDRMSEESSTPSMGNETNEKIQTIQSNRKLIKTGNIRFETKNFKKTEFQIKNAVYKSGGFISFEQQTNSNWSVRNDLEIRIPSEGLSALLDSISNGDYLIEEKNIKVVDVTNQYIDTESRIETKKLVEQKYVEHIKSADNIQDVLEIEQKIGYIREEIESAERRLRTMKDQIGLSTLKIEFYQKIDQPKFKKENEYLKGFSNGLNGLNLLFIGLTNIWPILIFGGVTLYFVRRKMKA